MNKSYRICSCLGHAGRGLNGYVSEKFSPITLQGLSADIVSVMQSNMNFTPIFVEADSYGTYDMDLNNGSGLVGLMHEGRIELASTFMVVTIQRYLLTL